MHWRCGLVGNRQANLRHDTLKSLKTDGKMKFEGKEELGPYPWGRLDYIRNSKTNKSVSVSVIFWKLI